MRDLDTVAGDPSSAGGCPSENRLIEYVEGVLAATDVVAIEQHVDGCASCCALLAGLAGAPLSSRGADEHASTGLELRRGATLGRYVLLDRIGAGGMGVVWAAFDPQLDRRVAIKVLRAASDGQTSEGRARLMREAQAMARLSHPNVVTVHDVGLVDDRVFLAMELLEGETLGAWLRSGTRTTDEILARFVAAGRGLAAAHEQGIVHRDFKPDNVLLGRDRVCVTDFGLARAQARIDAQPSLSELESVSVLRSLTRTGAFLGTPAYMSPEHLSGKTSDARSDQFSFCIALWEGLFGARPFRGETLGELAAAVIGGEVREPPIDARVPKVIVRALRRGLAVDPAERWPDMNGLLAVLSRDRGAVRRRVAMAALATSLVAVAAWGASRTGPAPCTGAEQRLVGVWDDARRGDVQRGLLATGVPFADAASTGVRARLDAYASAWITMHTDACEATAVRAEQSAEKLDRRMACLDELRSGLAELVEVLAHADADVARASVRAADALAPIERCADSDALLASARRPADPDTAARVVALREQLAGVVARADAGRPREAIAGFDPLVDEAIAIGWTPLVAETRHRRGRARAVVGDYDGAEADLVASYELALETGLDAIAADAATHLVLVVGHKKIAPDEGLRWVRHALALALRVGRDDVAEAKVRDNHGLLLTHEGDLAGAERELTRAREILEMRLGPEHIDVADIRTRLGDAALAGQQHARAEEHYLAAIAGLEAGLGPDHPHVVAAIANLGVLYLQRLEPDRAAPQLERALAIQEANLGADHPDLVMTLTNLGNVHGARKDYARARVYFERARDIAAARFGEQSSQVAIALVNLGDALHELGELEPARAAFEQTLASWERDIGADHVALAYPLTGLGGVLVDLRRADEAVTALERALALRTSATTGAVELADTRFALAMALVASGGDRVRAQSLAETARSEYATLGDATKETVAEVDAWLAAQ